MISSRERIDHLAATSALDMLSGVALMDQHYERTSWSSSYQTLPIEFVSLASPTAPVNRGQGTDISCSISS
jgi:hypothetical protein